MKIAIDTFSYYMNFGKHWYVPKTQVDIKWYCHKVKDLGAEGLHIDPYHIDLEKDAGWVRDFAIKNNMYVELGAGGTTEEELEPYIINAKKMNVGILRTFVGGSCLDDRREISKKIQKTKKNLEKSVRLAEKHGIKIAIENHGDIYIEDMKVLMEIDSKYLGICFDSGNYAFTGENPLDAISIFGERILCTHLKDVCGALQYRDAEPFETVGEPVHFCALGDGYLPMGRIIDKLSEQKIDRITIEICSPCRRSLSEKKLLEFEEENVKKSILFIKNHINTAKNDSQ